MVSVKDLVTALVTDSEWLNPLERYVVLVDLKNGDPPVQVDSVYIDHERKALILEKD